MMLRVLSSIATRTSRLPCAVDAEADRSLAGEGGLKRGATGVKVRGRYLASLLKIHWISSAICLLGMLLFSMTGITLNHASQIEARPQIVRSHAELPAMLLTGLKQQAAQDKPQVPGAAYVWLREQFRVDLTKVTAEWSAEEIYFPLPRPGGDAWLRIDLDGGEVEYELTDRGWISWLNDLHKGRHTGAAWSLFIDLFAVGCVLFSLTGLLILKIHAVQRHSTWPLVGLGVVIPVLLALLFIH